MKFYVSVWVGAILSLSFFLTSCTSKPTRGVANAGINADRARYLHQAADAGVLFLIGDSVLHDVPTQQVGSCRKADEPIWADNLFALLEGVDANPHLYDKVHVIELKRGDAAKIDIDKGSDGLTRLVIHYAKRTTFEKITPMTDVDCARSNVQYLNRDLEVTTFDWPSKEQMAAVLTAAPVRPNVERFNFNRKFLQYLADRMAVVKVTQKQLYSQSTSGEYAITSLLNKLDAEVATDPNYAQIDYWLKEISVQSKQANDLVFFGLNEDFTLPYGVKVDSAGKISRRINHQSDPSYLYLSFKETDGKYEMTPLKDLNSCLVELSKMYKSRYSGNREVASSLEMDKDSFLYPGYPCSTKQP